jgi:Xaa-Pro aminopeptidase
VIPGLLAVDYEDRIDFRRLRQERYERTLAAMERHGLDALVLTKPFHSKYVVGERQMFIAGRRGYAHCVVPRNPGRTAEGRPYLFITDADGVPPELPPDHVFVRYRNTDALALKTAELLGEAAAGTVGVDEWSVALHDKLVAAMPRARWVDAEPALQEARQVKTPEEVACLRVAAAICEAGLHAAVRALRPGVSEKAVAGVYMEHCAALGFSVYPTEVAVTAFPRGAPSAAHAYRPRASDRLLQPGDLVLLHASVSYMGYQAELTRTWHLPFDGGPSAAERDLHRRWRGVYTAALGACRPGASAGDLARAAAGREPPPPDYLARGIGLMVEPPFAGTTLGTEAEDTWTLLPGTALVLSPYVWREGVGGYRASETVLITESGPETLSKFAYGPLAD